MRTIIAGSGKVVYYLARHFSQKGVHTSIVAPHEREARELSRRTGIPVLAGDATDPMILREAGAYKADTILAMTSNDEDNLAVCQIAANIYRVPRTIALVNDPENEEVFQRLGVSVAISPTRVLTVLLEEQAGFEEIAKMISVAQGNVTVSEVILREESVADGMEIRAIDFPKDTLIGGVIRGGKVMIPNGNTILKGGDRLIVIANEDSLDQVMQVFSGEGAFE